MVCVWVEYGIGVIGLVDFSCVDGDVVNWFLVVVFVKCEYVGLLVERVWGFGF